MLNLYGETLRKELSMFLFISYDKVSFYVLSKGRVIYYQTISFTPIKFANPPVIKTPDLKSLVFIFFSNFLIV